MDSEVKEYFDSYASDFDAIYHQNKSWRGRIIDRLFRRGMEARFRYITDQAKVETGTTILDIGCGSGRYALALAGRGGRVTGIDFSLPMLRLARALSAKSPCHDRCRFICADFSALPKLRGEVVVAVGFFDYLSEPRLWLRKIKHACRGEAWITFPKKHELKAPLRRLWLMLRRCPLHLYSHSMVESLAADLHIPYEIITSIEGDFILHFWRE